MRQEFTKKQRAEIWLRADGHCQGCKAKLKVGEGEYDHIIPFALTQDTSVENGQLLCRVCHSGKTHKSDRPRISKAERMRLKHLGAYPEPIGNAKLQSRGFASTRRFQP
jgi:5-methylcytosine-specific restriction endonuclease McrA